MSDFQYKARDKAGQLVTGLMGADNAKAVALKLEQLGFLPVNIVPVRKGPPGLGPLFNAVRPADLNFFTRQLFTLQRAGLPLLGSLAAIKNQAANPLLQRTLEQIIRDIEAGLSLSEAMSRHPAIFDPVYVNMIKNGELTGRLAEVLERLALLGEHDEKTRMKISSAVRYPLIVMVSMGMAFIGLITIVIPRFAKVYGQAHTALPIPTKILIGANFVVTHFWWLILIALGLLSYALQVFVKTPAGRYSWDRFCLRAPVFGPLCLNYAVSRFCRLTGTLMKSGLPILRILELVEDSIGNVVVAKAVSHIRKSVNEGKGMLEPMKDSRLFPPVVLQMVAVGEETAKVDELLVHVADYYDSQIDFTVDNLVSLIEPFLILVLGFAVLFMALGIFMPMWGMMRLFQPH